MYVHVQDKINRNSRRKVLCRQKHHMKYMLHDPVTSDNLKAILIDIIPNNNKIYERISVQIFQQTRA